MLTTQQPDRTPMQLAVRVQQRVVHAPWSHPRAQDAVSNVQRGLLCRILIHLLAK